MYKNHFLEQNMNIVIRKATIDDAKAIASVHVRSWHESYIGIISDEYMNNLSYDERLTLRRSLLSDLKSNALHLIATDNGKVIGFCDAGAYRAHNSEIKGEIYAIYILNEYKNFGIGSQFMQQAYSYFLNNQFTPFIVWVLKENKIARKFYEKHGGIKWGEDIIKIGEDNFKEIAYLFNH